MKRDEKQELVRAVKAELGEVQHAVLIGYSGITVPQVTELRSQIRAAGGSYRVIKNRLLRRAVGDAPIGKLGDKMRGPTAVAWSADEPVALAKVLVAFKKTAPFLEVRAALLDGSEIDAAALEQVASMPGKHELQAQVAYVLASPMRRLVTALANPAQKLATVMSQYAEKKQN